MNRTQQTSHACLVGSGSGGTVQTRWEMWHPLERSQRLVMKVGQRMKALLGEFASVLMAICAN